VVQCARKGWSEFKGDAIALTVRALLRLPPLADADVLAGEIGLDREVSWPAVLRVRPPAFEPLSGYELAVVSVEALHLLDESMSLAQLIGRLAERTVAGVVVVGRVDGAAIERAEQAQLPLLRLPDSYHVADLGPTLSRVIAEQRARLYQLGLDAQHQFAEASMAGRGLAGIVARVAELMGRTVVLLDPSGEVMHRAVSDLGELTATTVVPVQALESRATPGAPARAEPQPMRVEMGDGMALAAPVEVRGVTAGYLVALAAADGFGDEDGVILARGSMVCALELAKQEAVSEAERRLRGDFFDDLLGVGASRESAEALINRGRHLGYDLQRTHAVLAVALDRPGLGDERGTSELDRVAREVGEYLNGRGAVGLVAQRRQTVAVFLANDGVGDVSGATRFAESLRDYLAGPVGMSVSIGVGNYHPEIAGLRLAYHEAEQAYEIGREFFGPGQVTAYADLGVYRLLYAFRQSNELTEFCDETLASLVEYDAKNGSALVETLDVYFRCDASLRAAADALYLHRNSLSYRLRRISEITGLNLDSLEDRFRLQLALKARRVAAASGQAGGNGRPRNGRAS
jgi:purine catabolism regulator